MSEVREEGRGLASEMKEGGRSGVREARDKMRR